MLAIKKPWVNFLKIVLTVSFGQTKGYEEKVNKMFLTHFIENLVLNKQ